MKMTLKRFAAGLCACAMAFSAFGCGKKDDSKLDGGKERGSAKQTDSTSAQSGENDSSAETGDSSLAPAEPEEPAEEYTYRVSLLCAGDNLIHDNIYNEAWANGNYEYYDFDPMYEHIERYLDGVDVAILNQETLVTDDYGPSTYPTFATPTACGDKMVDLGFNVISMSNNHVLDMGSDGLISSLDYWDTKDVVHYGAYRDEADSEDIKTMEVNGITFAFLGYMEHTNGFFLSDDEPGKVVYLEETDKIKEQIQRADEMADVVVVSCHYGTEIMNELNQMQIELTPQLVEWGADLIIGTQAHALSTCTYMDKPDGGQAFVYYGLGNFFSTMYDVKSLVGILGKLNVVKDPETGMISFEDVKAIPVISHFEGYDYYGDWFNCAVYPYVEYTDDLFYKNYVAGFSRETVEQCLSYVPEEFLSLE